MTRTCRCSASGQFFEASCLGKVEGQGHSGSVPVQSVLTVYQPLVYVYHTSQVARESGIHQTVTGEDFVNVYNNNTTVCCFLICLTATT